MTAESPPQTSRTAQTPGPGEELCPGRPHVPAKSPGGRAGKGYSCVQRSRAQGDQGPGQGPQDVHRLLVVGDNHCCVEDAGCGRAEGGPQLPPLAWLPPGLSHPEPAVRPQTMSPGRDAATAGTGTLHPAGKGAAVPNPAAALRSKQQGGAVQGARAPHILPKHLQQDMGVTVTAEEPCVGLGDIRAAVPG